MRKLYLCSLALLLVTVALTGCKKDSGDGDSTPEESIAKSDVAEPKTQTLASSAIPEDNNDSLAIPSPNDDISGRYQGTRAMLDIRQMSSDLSRFSIQMNAEGECTGGMNGILSMDSKHHGEYMEKGCMLDFNFNNTEVQVTEEGARCHDYHSNACSFSDDYKLGATVEERRAGVTVAGHYMHKRISIDDTLCTGWEIWLTGPNSALDARVAVYNNSCDTESIGVENLLYEKSASTLDFDVSVDGRMKHFSGVFSNNLDLHGQFTP